MQFCHPIKLPCLEIRGTGSPGERAGKLGPKQAARLATHDEAVNEIRWMPIDWKHYTRAAADLHLRHFVVIMRTEFASVFPDSAGKRTRLMFGPSARRVWFVSGARAVMIAVWLTVPRAGADEEPGTPPEVDSRQVIARLAGDYRLFLGPDRIPLEMQKEPVLRWPNPTREVPEGATFVWTLNGRPEAIGCIWNHGVLSHAFHSLSASTLVAEHNGRTIWRPAKAGIELLRFPDAPQPADSATKRLGQMKDLARRFTCRLSGERDGEELRLLPRPLYRYETNRDDLIDGALFAFVQGTDPEVVLVLECVPEETPHWQYALTRRSMLALEADLDGQRIWSVPFGGGAAGEAWFQGGIGAVDGATSTP
jgi:hypothetical protein